MSSSGAFRTSRKWLSAGLVPVFMAVLLFLLSVPTIRAQDTTPSFMTGNKVRLILSTDGRIGVTGNDRRVPAEVERRALRRHGAAAGLRLTLLDQARDVAGRNRPTNIVALHLVAGSLA